VEVDYGALSHAGLVRTNNEDHFLLARFGRFLTPLLTNLTSPRPSNFAEEGYGLVVADGIGGSEGGEVASDMAIRILLDLVLATTDWILGTSVPDAGRVIERMAERYRRVDVALAQQAEADDRLAGMGTTMTLACNLGPSLILAHVGDSRAYLFRAGKLSRLTRDHTMAQALVDMGAISRQEEASALLRRTLTRALGVGGPCRADVDRIALADQDRILLCTDGLTDMVADADIADVLREAPTAAEACQRLVDRALQNGGKDNVTVALAHYRLV
jgi:protein phosphatase